MALQAYPVGIQTFEEIRTKNYLYIDKTMYISRLLSDELKYVFLSRPRRFGKSLFTSTLKSYFEGRKDLFEGLAINETETKWTKYPVLYFDLSTAKHRTEGEFKHFIHDMLSENERCLGLSLPYSDNISTRLMMMIRTAYEQTGQQVVVLIDEYDAPLLDVAHDDSNLDKMRQIMRNFYSPLKACDPYLRFVYITGITKFSQLSIFSELNNITNISLDVRFSGICGITQSEIETAMKEHVDNFAECTGDTSENVLKKLKQNYDGYHFTWPSEDIYNPFSLMNSFREKFYGAYWFGSGTPTYLINVLRGYNVQPSEIGNKKVGLRMFDVPLETATSYLPLLYQSGYLTIKRGNRMYDKYILDIPNKEVRIGLMDALLPNYLNQSNNTTDIALEISDHLMEEDIDGALMELQRFLKSVPYVNGANSEGHWQQVIYIIFTLLGARLDVETHTAKGRVDMVLYGEKKIWLFELKLDKDAGAAISQIDKMEYSDRFTYSEKPVVKVGISFDSNERTLGEWIIEE